MVKIRKAGYNDFEGIRTLEERYGFLTKNYDEWIHLWKNNPALKDNKEWVMGWVLENDQKEIVGYFGNIPLIYEYAGRILIAGAATSFVVDLPHRNYSLLLMNAFFHQKKVDFILNTSANREAEKIFVAFKAYKIPTPSSNIAFFWITNYQGFIFSLFVKQGLPGGMLLKFPLSLVIWTMDKIVGRGRLGDCLTLGVKDSTQFDERFDIFWEKLKQRYPERILGVRSSSYLNWHFKYAMLRKEMWVLFTEKDFGIEGYAIFVRQDNPAIGLKRVRLIDLQSLNSDQKTLSRIMLYAINKCKMEKVHVLESIGLNSEKRKILQSMLPHTRRLLSWPFFYKSNDSVLAEALQNESVWDPSFFDGDSSI